MTIKWSEERIGDLCKRICSGGTPKSTNLEYYTDGTIPWLNTKEVNFNRIYHTEKKITEKALDSSSAKWIEANSVIVALYGETAGKVAITKIAITTNQACCNLTIDPQKADYNYVYFCLKNHYLSLINLKNGGAQQNLNVKIIRDFVLKLPPLEIQHAIASILSSLDDKIETNTRMNKVLEEIARALFHRWFVEFEFPDAEGRPYKSSGGKMVESEMGIVPEGWKIDQLKSIIEIIGGGTPKTSVGEYWNGNIPWFSVVDAPHDGDIFVIDTEKHITQLGILNSSTQLLPVGTTIISARGTVGKCALVGVPMTMNQSCYGIRGKKDGMDYFVYFVIRSMVRELQLKSHGSVFSTITRDTINTQNTIIPEISTIQKYNELIYPLFLKIQTNLLEKKYLSNLRDSLLPKLMSGELLS